jgi:hypothetical protein
MKPTGQVVRPDYQHLLRMSDDTGLFEHSWGYLPRREHGYCLDDVARGLVVLSRERRLSPELLRLQETLLTFTAHAHEDGRFRNRLGYDRRWQDDPGLGDWWGRALWGLGSTAANDDRARVRRAARALFDSAARHRSPGQRAMVFAALGAAEMLARKPQDAPSRQLLDAAVIAVGPIPVMSDWRWPEPRLRYANAAVAEALIAAGSLLPDVNALADGLRVLEWLVNLQTQQGHLSVVPAGGWVRGEGPPGFDQQPIEVAALAAACARAHAVTGATKWAVTVRLAREWFLGLNDAGTPLADRATGGCADGLRADGVSTNQGAESTLALLHTWQLDLHRMDLAAAAGVV